MGKGTRGKIISKYQADDYNLDGSKAFTNEGFIKTSAIVTRVGVFNYTLPDGSIQKQLRLPEEVFAKDSLESMKMIPVTDKHPSGGKVTVENARQLQCGQTGEMIVHDGKYVTCPFTVTDASAVQHVKNGRNQLSLGYTLDLEFTSGTYNGDAYDCIQRNIRYNHLALVDIARAGDIAKIQLDSIDAILFDKPIHKGDGIMPKINLDNGLEYEALPEVVTAFKAKITALDEANTIISTMKTTVDKCNGTIAALTEENKTLKGRNIDSEIKSAVDTRLNVLCQAATVLDDKELEGIDKLSNHDIKLKVIAKHLPELALDGKSVDYVDAVFDTAYSVASKGKEKAAFIAQRKQSTQKIVNDEGDNEELETKTKKACDGFIEKTKAAWKKDKK